MFFKKEDYKMLYANNKDNIRIYADDAHKDESYFCPCCEQKMILKKGKIREPHFAHKGKQCDDWYSENKGPWHRGMQNYFPKEFREVTMRDRNNKKIF